MAKGKQSRDVSRSPIDDALQRSEALFEEVSRLSHGEGEHKEREIVSLLGAPQGPWSEAQMDALVSMLNRSGDRGGTLGVDDPVWSWARDRLGPPFLARALRNAAGWNTVESAVRAAMRAGVDRGAILRDLLRNTACAASSLDPLHMGVQVVLTDSASPVTMRDLLAEVREGADRHRVRAAFEAWLLGAMGRFYVDLHPIFSLYPLYAAGELVRLGHQLACADVDVLDIMRSVVLRHGRAQGVAVSRALLDRASPSGGAPAHLALLAVRLPIAMPVRVERLGVLRFGYLRRYLRVGERNLGDHPELGLGLSGLEELQQRWDAQRDEFLIRRASAEKELRSSAEESRLPEAWPPPDIVEAENALYGESYRRLVNASRRLVGRLGEVPIDWERVDPDGVFGEFHPAGRTITLYPEMVRLLARDPRLRANRLDDDGVMHDLLDIAETHEQIHANMILGLDAADASWVGFEDVSYVLHEALATRFTELAVQRHGADAALMATWEALRPMLPKEYCQLLQKKTAPRALLARLREVRGSDPAGRRSADLQLALSTLAGTLALALGKDRYEAFRAAMGSPDSTLRTRVTALRERWPEVVRALDALHPHLVPGPELRWLDDVVRACAGPAVGAGSLRIRVDWIRDGAIEAARAAERDRKNSPALELPGFDNVMAQIRATPDDLERFRGVTRRPR